MLNKSFVRHSNVANWKNNPHKERIFENKTILLINDYSIAVITFYLLRPLKLTNQNQSQI
jgi:hypothetical protein